MKVTLCASCALGRSGFAETLAGALTEAGVTAQIATTDCMSGCKTPSTLAFRTEGKMAYLFGDVTAADLADIVTFARLYAESSDGTLADARPIGALRFKALARIPA